MNVPILRLPFSEADLASISEDIRAVFQSGSLTMGGQTRAFEERFAEFTGSRYALAVSSGTSALEVIIRALGIEGKSFIVPTNTFLATALAVMHSGNRVIFADSDPETLCLDPDDLERRIDGDTAGVVLVHIGGVITPAYDRIRAICDARGLALVEDCAHAHGSALRGRQAGTLGVAGAFSFFPTKALTCGEGGMITTDDEVLYRNAAMIRNHGKNPDLGNKMSEFGYNWRMSEITAAVGVRQMMRAGEIVRDRQRAAAFYDERLGRVAGVRPLKLAKETSSCYYKYIAYLDEGHDRARVKQVMREACGVSLTGEVYADLCHKEPIWEKFTCCGRRREQGPVACNRWPSCGCGGRQAGFPGAEYLSRHHICLPIYPGLTEEELQHVVDSLDRTLNGDLSKGAKPK